MRFLGNEANAPIFDRKKKKNDKTRGKKELDSVIFEIPLHTFSQALRATFFWGRQPCPCSPCAGLK